MSVQGYGFGRMAISPDSLSEEARTVRATVATDQPVAVFDFEGFRVIDEILVGRGGRFPSSVPMLDSHVRASSLDVIGGVTDFVMRNGKWDGLLTFDTDEPSSRVFGKVQRGFLRDVSVGYDIRGGAMLEPGKAETIDGTRYEARTRPLRVATEWAAREVSVTPIGADDQAKIRSFVSGLRQTEPPATTEFARELQEHIRFLWTRYAVPTRDVHRDLKGAAGINEETLADYLSGRKAPTRDVCEAFAAALQCSSTPLLWAAGIH